MIDVDLRIKDNSITDAEAQRLRENIKFFCNTPKGSLPQNRGYGLDMSVLDEPFHIMRMKATVDILSGIQKYYGVRLSTIDVSADGQGGARVKLTIN